MHSVFASRAFAIHYKQAWFCGPVHVQQGAKLVQLTELRRWKESPRGGQTCWRGSVSFLAL